MKNNDINFFGIEPYIKSLINNCYKKYISYKIQVGFQENSKNKGLLEASILRFNNMEYYNNCYIMPSKILDKIIKYEFNNLNITLMPQKYFLKMEIFFFF